MYVYKNLENVIEVFCQSILVFVFPSIDERYDQIDIDTSFLLQPLTFLLFYLIRIVKLFSYFCGCLTSHHMSDILRS